MRDHSAPTLKLRTVETQPPFVNNNATPCIVQLSRHH
mgnify:CR=1 FL=1